MPYPFLPLSATPIKSPWSLLRFVHTRGQRANLKFCHCVLHPLSLCLAMHYLKSGSPLAIFLLCFRSFTLSALAHSPAEEMAEAANNFLAALTPEQRTKAVF